MIEKLVATISGSIGMFNKSEAIAGLGSISNKQTAKINELINAVNELQKEVNELKQK